MTKLSNMFIQLLISAFVVLGIPNYGVAQTAMDHMGACNQNATEDGNNVTVNCANRSSATNTQTTPVTEFDVAINFSGGAPIETWIIDDFNDWLNINPETTFMDKSKSSYALQLDGVSYAYSLSEPFDGGVQTLDVGQHEYSMIAEIVYQNGFRTKTYCGGLLDIQSDASLVPKLHIESQYHDGHIRSIKCGFIANQ